MTSDLAETLSAVENAIAITLPDSKVYHEDIVYAAARAAFSDDDIVDQAEESDCCSDDELEGCEESGAEKRWQIDALRTRLENPSDNKTMHAKPDLRVFFEALISVPAR